MAMIVCPNCGFQQELSPHCRQCKIHIQSFMDDILQAASAISASNETVPDDAIVCPKCGFFQSSQSACEKCGIVFRKYLDEQIRAIEQSAVEVEPKIASEETNGFNNLLTEFGVDSSRWKEAVVKWARKLVLLISQLMLLTFIVGMAYGGLLYLLRTLWYLYLATHVGGVYFRTYTAKAQFIMNLLEKDLLLTSFSLTLVALCAGLIIGVFIRLTFIARFFYTGRGLLFRTPVWGTICTLATAWLLIEFYALPPTASLTLSAIPGFCLFLGCFRLVFHLTPEPDLSRLIQYIKEKLKHRRLRLDLQQVQLSGEKTE